MVERALFSFASGPGVGLEKRELPERRLPGLGEVPLGIAAEAGDRRPVALRRRQRLGEAFFVGVDPTRELLPEDLRRVSRR